MGRRYEKALVTGGAGFIGSHIAGRLKALGMEVAVIDDLSMGSLENLPSCVEFHHGSILDQALMKKALAGVDIVFHNAAKVSIRNSFDDIYGDTETNVLGTVNVLREAGKAKIKKFIFASSMAVYGDRARLPVAEDGILEPISPYGAGKLAAEAYVRQLARYYGFESVVLRYFNTYGPGQTLTPYVGVITIFINSLLQGRPPMVFGSGAQVRDFVYVGDVAEANILAMKSSVNGMAVNVGTGKGTSVNDIASLLISRLGPGLEPVRAPLPLGEPKDSVADITRARNLLGFDPRTRVEHAISEVIESVKANFQAGLAGA
ncbi:MAG: NAD-dependent epimerase/dehydratase family protein [Deltaproteobacteria bacterium]|nr:NAD-dependent epimerase/dehydratase family protein [Deltaproteobacteria bacterium]